MTTARALPGWVLFALSLTIALTAGAGVWGIQGPDQTIYATVLDASGQPLTGLTAVDFAIREDGVDREVLTATLATEPLRIALLVDTSTAAEEYVSDIRAGCTAFVQAVMENSADAQISLWEFGQASVRIKDFTSDAAALERHTRRLFPKPRAASVLLEALYDASEALASRPSPRRAIVVLNLEPADEQSRQEPKKITDSLMRSRAQLWAVSVQRGTLQNAQRDLVLNTLVRSAGGLREFIVAPSAIAGYMRQYAAALTAQYELTYRRPSGRPQVVQTGVRRDGAKVIAGILAPR